MLLKALTIASLATLAVAAPTGTTCNFQRISPKPKGTTCQNTQALKNPLGAALIQRYTVPESVANPYVQCGTTCSTTSGCLSFAYRADLRGCRLYNKTLKNAGLVAGSTATGIASDDMACFKKVCTTPVTPTSSSTSTTPVTPTCTTSRVSPTVSLPNPTTLVAPNQDSAVYNPEATLNIPWTFQMFGQSFSSFDMNQFGVSRMVASKASPLTNLATYGYTRWLRNHQHAGKSESRVSTAFKHTRSRMPTTCQIHTRRNRWRILLGDRWRARSENLDCPVESNRLRRSKSTLTLDQ